MHRLITKCDVTPFLALLDTPIRMQEQDNERAIHRETSRLRRYTIMMKPRREILLPYHMPGTSARLPDDDRHELSLWTAVE